MTAAPGRGDSSHRPVAAGPEPAGTVARAALTEEDDKNVRGACGGGFPGRCDDQPGHELAAGLPAGAGRRAPGPVRGTARPGRGARGGRARSHRGDHRDGRPPAAARRRGRHRLERVQPGCPAGPGRRRRRAHRPAPPGGGPRRDSGDVRGRGVPGRGDGPGPRRGRAGRGGGGDGAVRGGPGHERPASCPAAAARCVDQLAGVGGGRGGAGARGGDPAAARTTTRRNSRPSRRWAWWSRRAS